MRTLGAIAVSFCVLILIGIIQKASGWHLDFFAGWFSCVAFIVTRHWKMI